ncbi:hypothetical protein M514_03698, partial [Trichuris suis]
AAPPVHKVARRAPGRRRSPVRSAQRWRPVSTNGSCRASERSALQRCDQLVGAGRDGCVISRRLHCGSRRSNFSLQVEVHVSHTGLFSECV